MYNNTQGGETLTKYAYVRVSTKEQNVDRQLMALEPYGIQKKNIYCDHQSGKDFDRPEYKRLMRKLRPGDLLVVKSIDRLGRNYNEILVQWQTITKDIGADILVIDLQIMAYFAQTERDSIRQRQAEGIAAARAQGKHLGRKAAPLPDGFEDICMRCMGGEISTRNAAKILAMSHTSFYRNYKKWLQNKSLQKKSNNNPNVPDGRLLKTVI